MDSQEFNFLQNVEVPHWMTQSLNNLEDSSAFLQSLPQNHEYQEQIHTPIINQNSLAKPQASYEIPPQSKLSNSESDSQQSSDEKSSGNKSSIINKKQSKEKQQRRNQTCRKYRERKKQRSKQLEEENRFLKFKVQQLTFKLQEVTLELNKIKNLSQNSVPNYHKVKAQCFEQLQKMFQHNIQDANAFSEIQQKLGEVMAFDGKQKVDLLNYFMSELMQNVISDKCFYMLDCLINKKGLHRPNDSVPLTKLDQEVFEIIKIKNRKNLLDVKHYDWQSVKTESKKFQQLWKTLYQVYLAILNQGFKMKKCIQGVRRNYHKEICFIDMLKLDLFFEKNKYRSDIREMRNRWFRELEKEKYPSS